MKLRKKNCQQMIKWNRSDVYSMGLQPEIYVKERNGSFGQR